MYAKDVPKDVVLQNFCSVDLIQGIHLETHIREYFSSSQLRCFKPCYALRVPEKVVWRSNEGLPAQVSMLAWNMDTRKVDIHDEDSFSYG